MADVHGRESGSNSRSTSAATTSSSNPQAPSNASPIANPNNESNPSSDIPPRLLRNPKLHLFGMKRSGKTSICKVVFHYENPMNTLYLYSTNALVKEEMKSFMNFDIYDYPANLNINDPETSPASIFSATGALVWIIDAQDEYLEPIDRLIGTMASFAQAIGEKDGVKKSGTIPDFRLPPWVSLNIFIHKTDGLSDDFKEDIFSDIEHRVREGLAECGLHNLAAAAAFYQTSIYDQTIFEGISKVFQKLIPSHKHGAIEGLINSLVSNCGIEKAYLFEIQWRFYVASDTTPGDLQKFQYCSDFVAMNHDIFELYGWRDPPKDGVLGEKYDDDYLEASCTSGLPGVRWIFMKGINKHLAMVCIMGTDKPDDNEEIIRMNFRTFQRGLRQMLAVPITSGFHA